MPNAKLAQQVEEDLRAIFRHIAIIDKRPETARKVVHEIRQHCRKYADAFAAGNVIGTDRSDIGEGYRTFSHQRWVILFRAIEKGILVIAVVDGSRDYDKLLKLRGNLNAE